MPQCFACAINLHAGQLNNLTSERLICIWGRLNKRYACADQLHIGPVERSSAKKHVPDERFDWRLANESNEEELFDDLSRDGP